VIIGLIACAVMTFAAAWQFGGASFRSAAGNPATAGMNANPELDGNARPETAPRGISADLIAEVSANEPVNFAANLKQMNVQLRSLEARQQSKLQFSQPDNWSQELQSMHQRLDRLQPQDSESPYPIPGEMP